MNFILLGLAAANFVVQDEEIGSGADALHVKVLKNSDTGEYVEVRGGKQMNYQLLFVWTSNCVFVSGSCLEVS